MSRDFYFDKWKGALQRLKQLVDIDLYYQEKKVHDQTLPEAVYRLSAILGQYMLIYNEIIECVQHNLQVQKTAYMGHIVKAVVSRILELKRDLKKLEGSEFQFIGRGLIEVHHTIRDIEIVAIPKDEGRPKNIQTQLEDIIAKVKEKKEALEQIAEEPEESGEDLDNLWDEEINIKDLYSDKNKVEVISEETRKTREYVNMILAHEKTRQMTTAIKASKQKRENWEKELTGRLQPKARYELREKSSVLIQAVFRGYFKIKRERIITCKRDELLGLNICKHLNKDKQRKEAEEMLRKRSTLHETYDKERLAQLKHLKQTFLELKKAELIEECADQIREWLMEWYESVKFFHDIPKEGSAAIFRGEVPSPYEWQEENNALILQKKANKQKSPQDLKFDKMQAKNQENMLKKEEQMKEKAEALLLKKMMKNPTMHPGYNYPHSKHTGHLQKVINNYHKSWDIYDEWPTKDVKEKYINEINVEDAINEAKFELLPEVDELMRTELCQLKQALKEDYANKEEVMPENLTRPVRVRKGKKILKADLSKRVSEITENLIEKGFIVEYPKTKIEDFIGDPNFGGEELRAKILTAFPFNNEIRAYWWERCLEVCHGFHKILLVGPKNSGKNLLVKAMASINGAVLFELDPYKIEKDQQTASFLKRLQHDVVTCAKAVQPAVLHIKFIHKLFYTKVPPEEADMNFGLLKTYLVQKLLKKINKTDKITVIGSCIDPWLAKSSALLKLFPKVLLLPNSHYSLIFLMLKEWVHRHNVIPADFNVSSLAQVLQGYSSGYLKKILEDFMSAERIVKISAFGLSELEVYNYILDDETENKIEYDKYLNWYTENTTSGKKEMQHLQEQRDFKAAVEKYAAKNRKKTKSAPSSTTASYTGL